VISLDGITKISGLMHLFALFELISLLCFSISLVTRFHFFSFQFHFSINFSGACKNGMMDFLTDKTE